MINCFYAIYSIDTTCSSLASNPLRNAAKGRPVYSVPFVVFVDDVSGNVSKQWNKHWCCYVSNASLPRVEINKRRNVRFMCTTQHASPSEMLEGITQTFSYVVPIGVYSIALKLGFFDTRSEAFEKMVVAWDAKDQQEVLIRPYILVIPGDNPMQALECSSTGLNSNLFCRTCDVGGTNEFKASDKGYDLLFQVCNRFVADTFELLLKI